MVCWTFKLYGIQREPTVGLSRSGLGIKNLISEGKKGWIFLVLIYTLNQRSLVKCSSVAWPIMSLEPRYLEFHLNFFDVRYYVLDT